MYKQNNIAVFVETDHHLILASILHLLMLLRDQHPQVYQLLDEMPLSIPNEKNPKITASILSSYQQTLVQLLRRIKPTN